MKLYIPTIGDELLLIADWTFDLYNEDRNTTIMEYINDPRAATIVNRWAFEHTAEPCTIKAGTVLTVDRIYIRKGKEGFDSISFFWKGARTEPRIEHNTIGYRGAHEIRIPRKPVRFWVKLEDANNIEFDRV